MRTASAGAGAVPDGPARERESILRMAELEFDALLAGHGRPLRPEASARVRGFAKGLPPA